MFSECGDREDCIISEQGICRLFLIGGIFILLDENYIQEMWRLLVIRKIKLTEQLR